MKRLTTFLLTLFLITLGASAQTDYTSALDAGTWYGNTGTYDGGIERYDAEVAVNGTTPVPVLCQTITGLPAGTYSVTFYAVANNAWVGAAVGEDIAQVFANETAEDIEVYDQTGCTLADYPHTLTCTVGVDGILVYGLQNIATGGNWYVAQGVSLTLIEESGATLQVGDVLHTGEASIAHWATTGNNGTFVMNDWSTEADASGMVVPFCQNWVWSGEANLSAATISHAQFDNLPAGTYEVSLDVRIFSEAGNEIGEGTTLAANDASVDVVAEGTADVYGTATEVYGTYVLTATVDENGTLDISLDIPEGVSYNWIAWKNLSVTYLGEAEEEEPGPEVVDGNDNDYEIGDVVTVDGNVCTVVGENLFVNGGFGDGMNGWTAGGYTTAADPDNFDVKAEGGYNGGAYLFASSAGATNAKTPSQAIAVEVGKSYMLVAYTSGKTPDSNNLRYSALFEMEDATTEASHTEGTTNYSNDIITLEWGADPAATTDEWTQTIGVFEATTEYVGMRMGWSGGSYDGFQLYEVEVAEVEPEPDNSYVFVNTDWVYNAGRTSENDVVYNEDGTITVTASGDNNLSLGNTLDSGLTTTTSEKTVSSEQKWFTIIATNLVTDNDPDNWTNNPSFLWWLNGANYGTQVPATQVETLSDGRVLVAWDVTLSGIDDNLKEEENYLNGWTCFGLTSTTGTSVISDINFYTDEELEAIIAGEPEPEPTPEPVVEEGEYLIVNAEGNYLGGGLTWGTQAAIIGKPQFIGFEVQDDGTYHLDSHQYNSATAHYLGSNLYFDSTPVDWIIAEVDGGYTIYGTVDDGTGYLTSNGFQTVPTVEADPYVWTLVTKDDVIASMADATEDAPVDVTALIAAPELKRNCNTSYDPTWTVTGYDGTGTPSNYAFGSGSATANCAESYHSTNGFNFSQEITLPLAGTYTLSAQGFYRDDSSTTLLLPVLYAGEESVEFPELDTSANTMAEAYAEFLEGQHQIGAITITAEEDGETVTIGFKGEDTSLWNIMGELTLLYLGEAEVPEPTEIVDIHECEAEFDHWSIAGNSGGAFQLNTWSTEADESGMKTPFIEYWVGTGSVLSNATISHTQLTDLEDGYYSVSIFARAFNEGSSTPVSEGITFTANEESIDLTTGTTATYNNASEEVYGTYTLLVYVTGGTLDIGFTVADLTACDWVAFKNLSVEYFGAEMPTLAAVSGVMNADVEAAMQDAVEAYNADKTLDNYYAAVEAIEEAEASIEYYAPIVEVVDALDEDGAAAWAESDYAAMLEARTLTNEDVSADLAAAQKAQTTAGSDMTYAVQNSGAWGADQGNGPASYSTFATETYIGSGEATVGTVLYKTIEGLTAGTYTVSFYVAANMANGISGDSGEGITEAYANDGDAVAITVGTNSAAQITSLDDMTLVTITCTVGSDGVLTFGLQNVGDGGNWFLGAACSLTLNEVLDEDLADLILRYNDDCVAAEECEANLADMIENGDKTDETKASMAEALEALEAVMAEYGDIDTSDTTIDELTAACEAIEAALAEAQDVYATGLQSVTVATESNAIYTLSGVRLNKITKSGIYIVDGKKVLVK